MPLKVTNVAGGTVHPSPFLGPINHSVPVRVDVSGLGSDEVDAFGFLKPGVILTREGKLALDASYLISSAALAIGSTVEEYSFGAFVGVVDGQQFAVALDATIAFTGAHTITALKFGVVVIQVTPAGVVTSIVASATQAYDTAAEALDAAPTADAGNVVMGHIAIEADAGDWVAQTDDLTDASDLTTAAFVQGDVSTLNGNERRGYGANIEAVKVAAGNTAALLAAAVDIDIAIATVCMIQRHILEDSLGRALTGGELSNTSESIVITTL